MLNLSVHLGGWSYELEPHTGHSYCTCPEAQWTRGETPRLAGAAFAPPPPHFMRDPTLPTSWSDTGGTPIEASQFRSLARPGLR